MMTKSRTQQRKHIVFTSISALASCFLLDAALAQTPADAGSLQQQIERERQQQLPGRIAPEVPARPAESKPGGVTVTVREFRFVGNTLIPAERLAKAVADYVGKPLDFSQLQAATAVIADTYRKEGWVVRAYLPKQDIREGVVTIQIIEAVFGKVVTEGKPTRVAAGKVVSRIEAQQDYGAPLDADDLDRGLLLANDLPGVAAAGALRAGARHGETDLLLKLTDEPFLNGNVGADNYGQRSTGENRITGNLALNSPLGLGDQLGANLVHSRGSDYLRLGYTKPAGVNGMRVGVNASWLNYDLVAPEFRSLDGQGESNTFGVESSFPAIRSRLKNLFFNVNIDRKSYDNRTLAGTTSNYDIDMATLTLLGNLFDSIGGGGANTAYLAYSYGGVHLGSPDIGEDRALSGGFGKWRYSLARQQVITTDLSLLTTWTGQWANENLDSSEKFYLGGAYGVRAYPSSEGGGAKGNLLNLELRWRLPWGLSTSSFYDYGRITQNVNNRVLQATPNTYELKGYGLSLGWQSSFGLSLKGMWARRDGENPNPTATGRDQDGSYDKNRWWLSADLAF